MINEAFPCQNQVLGLIARELTQYGNAEGGIKAFISQNAYFCLDNFENISKEDVSNPDIKWDEEFYWGTCEEDGTVFESLETLIEVIKKLCDFNNKGVPEFEQGLIQEKLRQQPVYEQQVHEMPPGFVPCEECKYFEQCGSFTECPNSEV